MGEYEKQKIRNVSKKMFEDIRKVREDGKEYWSVRDLAEILGYSEFRNFIPALNKAREACENSGQATHNHFVDFHEMVQIGSNAVRKIGSVRLSRYACYLIVQNADPKKEMVALGQTYFAVQTRRQEIHEKFLQDMKRVQDRKKLTEAEKKFSSTLVERGVPGRRIAEVRSAGDKELFGGNSTKDMKKMWNVRQGEPIADYAPSAILVGKSFAAEITIINSQKKDLYGVSPIKTEHVLNNEEIRALLKRRGIVPEELEPEENVKYVEKKYQAAISVVSNPQQKILLDWERETQEST